MLENPASGHRQMATTYIDGWHCANLREMLGLGFFSIQELLNANLAAVSVET